jgi:outer membrane immunogenic protein
MKKILLASIAAAAFCGAPAIAADMPVKAPVYKASPAPMFSWTGFYVGAQIGYGWLDDRQHLQSPTFSLNIEDRPHGIVGGGHAGYNWQVGQSVFGIEADLEGSGIKSTFPIGAPFVATTGTERLNSQASIRARLGYAVDRVLFYATGGAAFAHFRDTYSTPAGAGFFDSVSSTRTGWTIGGGVEVAAAGPWSSRIEYRYIDFGTHTNNLPNFLVPPGFSRDRVTEQQVLLGLSYRFGDPWGKGPVVAKY